MALSRPLDLTADYKANIYSITLDMNGWDSTTLHFLAPVAATVWIYGSNDAGMGQGITDGDASLATNFTKIAAKPLSQTNDTTLVDSISTAGLYKINIGAQFLRIQGGGADVYRLYAVHHKIS